MAGIRKTHTVQFKTKVAIEAIKEHKTINELTVEHGIHASQLSSWKKQALEIIPQAFSSKKDKSQTDQQTLIEQLYQQIGQLTVECEFLKKSLNVAR
jgi:transposase